jgi:hypothetical protein
MTGQGRVARMVGKWNAYGRLEGKISLQKSGHIWEDIIKMDLIINRMR